MSVESVFQNQKVPYALTESSASISIHAHFLEATAGLEVLF